MPEKALPKVETKVSSQKPAYLTWTNDKEKSAALAQAHIGIQRANAMSRARGSDVFFDIGSPNISVRDGFNRGDYDLFRPEERTPLLPRNIMLDCMRIYDTVGLIKNIIDLMGDFASQGVGVMHPNEKIDAFYKEWFKKVKGPDRTERFCNYLYRMANVIVKRNTAKLTQEAQHDLERGIASPELKHKPKTTVKQREIPWSYTFLNPLVVELLAEEVAPFLGSEYFMFAINIPDFLHKKIVSAMPGSPIHKMLGNLPKDLLNSISSNVKKIPLDKEKVTAYYYKRDDWLPWAKPIIHSIIPDINQLLKMKLCDLSAIEGMLSSIRVWKLGNIEAKLIPSENTIMNLAQMLTNNVGGGVMDLVWGPDIELKETSMTSHKYLGEAKYKPVLQAIFSGLGVPPTLTGSEGASGTTNNYISLKTLVERLQYGRGVVKSFWDKELRLVQAAMNFKIPATLTFDNALTDDAVEKQLLLNMYDRNLITRESIQEIIGLDPNIEEVRERRDMAQRDNNMIPEKASPFHNTGTREKMKQTFAQTGAYPPSQFGVELDPALPGEKSPADVNAKNEAAKQADAPKGQPGQGRPPAKKDATKRKTKNVKPRTSAALIQNINWAEEALNKIGKITSLAHLTSLGKKTARELTDKENRSFQDFKFNLLCQFKLGDEISKEAIKAKIGKSLPIPVGVDKLLKTCLEKNEDPSVDSLRKIHAGVYAVYAGEYPGPDDDEDDEEDDDVFCPLLD